MSKRNYTMSEEKREEARQRMKALNEKKQAEPGPIGKTEAPARAEHPFKKAKYTRAELMRMVESGEIQMSGLAEPSKPSAGAPAVIDAGATPGAYTLPERLGENEVLVVRYDMDGKWTKGWYKKSVGQTVNCAANMSSPGHRVKFTEQKGRVLAEIVNYGWSQDITFEKDLKKPLDAPVTNAKDALAGNVQVGVQQVAGTSRVHYSGWRFPQSFSTLGAAADAVMEWIENKEMMRTNNLVEAVTEVV